MYDERKTLGNTGGWRAGHHSRHVDRVGYGVGVSVHGAAMTGLLLFLAGMVAGVVLVLVWALINIAGGE